MRTSFNILKILPFAVAAILTAAPAHAAIVDVTVTFRSLVPANSVSFAPLRFGFNSGVFDAFNAGTRATAAITSIAEGGSGSAWIPAFQAADPTAVIGAVGGPIVPGQTVSTTVRVDTAVNPFFTFAQMVVPSNDFFIGNDSSTQFRVLDNGGNLLINTINQKVSDIWDNGSEVFSIPNAAFIVGSNNSARINDPTTLINQTNLSAKLAQFDGVTTAAGYILASNLTANQDLASISFSVTAVPEPASLMVLASGLGMLVATVRRRRVG